MTKPKKQADKPVANKPGPKPKLEHSDNLLDQIRALGRIQATVEECASVLRVSERTLQNFFSANPDAKDAHEEGKLEGLASLRRKQFAMADKNAAMAIWLGKQYLKQREPVQQVETGQPGDFDRMSDEELAQALASETKELMELDPEFAAQVRSKPRRPETKH